MSNPVHQQGIESGITRIGWIPTSVMGLPRCQHIQGAGEQLFVFSRSRERATPLPALESMAGSQ
jgi:hypothetical protein